MIKIKIKIICSWTTTHEISKLWSKMRPKNSGIELTEDKKADYYVIINKPYPGSYYEPEKTIVFVMEPDWETNPIWKYTFPENSELLSDGKVLFQKEPAKDGKLKPCKTWLVPELMYVLDHNHMNNSEWHLSLTHSELVDNSSEMMSKTKGKIISSVMSSLNIMEGHKLRLEFLKELESKTKCEIFGRDNKFNFKSYIGPLPPNKKDDGILPYKYTFITENCDKKNYYTEKLIDSILGETLCFYSGPSNISDFINPRAFFEIDLKDRDRSIKQIMDAINNDEWEKRIDFIREEKKKILNHYNFFNRIEGLIRISNLKVFTSYTSPPSSLPGYLNKDIRIFQNPVRFPPKDEIYLKTLSQDLSTIELEKIKFDYDQVYLISNHQFQTTPHFLQKLGIFLQILKNIDWDIFILDYEGENNDKQMVENIDTRIIQSYTFRIEKSNNILFKKSRNLDKIRIFHPAGRLTL